MVNILSSRPRLALFAIGVATGLLVTSGDPGIDTIQRLQVTHSLWTREPPVRPGEYPAFGVAGRGGTIHAWYGLGQSLAMLPADVIATHALRAARVAEPYQGKARIVLVCLLTFPLIAGLTLVSVFVLFKRLGFAEHIATLGALALQFGTGHLTYTQIHQENSLLMLLTASGLALTVGEAAPLSRLLLGMQLAASAVLVRLTALLDFGSVVVLALVTRRSLGARTNRGRLIATAAASAGLYLALDRAYQWLRFGDFTTTYIHLYGMHARALNPALPEAYPFVTPFREGFVGPFLSPQRSVFLLEPLLTVALVVTVVRLKQAEGAWKAAAAVLGCLLLAQVGFYATYYDWSGAAAWGDRFITVPVHLLGALGVAVALSQWKSLGSWGRRTVAVTFAGAVAIQLASVALWYNLEEAQALHWHRPVLLPWQRFVNLTGALLGRFEEWGLAYPGFTPRVIRPNFLPFLVESYLPRTAACVVQGLWGICVVALAVFVVVASRRLWRSEGDNSRRDIQDE